MKNIHSYRQSDQTDICLIWRQSARLAYSFLTSYFILKEETHIEQVYLPKCNTLVWKDGQGKALGFISLMGNEIGGLFVLPEFQNQGIGKELVKHVFGNFPVLFVEVFAKNRKGIGFYEKMGFSIFKEKIHAETGETLLRMARHNK